jgi:hypothetical protein
VLIDSNLLGVDGTAEYIEILARKVFGIQKGADENVSEKIRV